MRQELGINLLVYREQLEQGIRQSQLLKEIDKQGISLAEIRREYIADHAELEAIGEEAGRLGIELYYSVPEKIMDGDRPNEKLRIYLEEAMSMHVKNVKFNIGSLWKGSRAGIEELKEILKEYPVTVTIENDQTEENGTFTCTEKTLEVIRNSQLPVGYTMDLGNWYWQNENPEQAFAALHDAIDIFHLKNIAFSEGKPETVLLEEGMIPWRSMIKRLKEDVVVFLEYPIAEEEIENQVNTIKSAE